jgi:hypothetical protein
MLHDMKVFACKRMKHEMKPNKLSDSKQKDKLHAGKDSNPAFTTARILQLVPSPV